MNEPHRSSPGDGREVLRARARALARRQEAAVDAAEMELLVFHVGGQQYAVELQHVAEVYPLRSLTPLPATPPFVLGIANVRGRMVPVYELARLFELPAAGLADLHRLIVIAGNGLELALLADASVFSRRLPINKLQPALPTRTAIRSAYLKGIGPEGLVVLDVGRILSDPGILVGSGDSGNGNGERSAER